MSDVLNSFGYVHMDNKVEKTIFLLHGTGGDENDFLYLDQELKAKYNLVGLRGNIKENGMNRFFRRLQIGVFDQANIKEEAEKLHKFVLTWMHTHSVSSNEITFLGYSNGANMLLALLFYYPEIITSLVLLHPMLPFTPHKEKSLSFHTICMTYGTNDPIIPLQESLMVRETLASLGARLTLHEYQTGHELTRQEITDIVNFLLNRK